MTDAERDEAVAALRRAADLILDGAEVGRPSWPPPKVESSDGIPYAVVSNLVLRPSNARRFALDLLAAAEAAEAEEAMQP